MKSAEGIGKVGVWGLGLWVIAFAASVHAVLPVPAANAPGAAAPTLAVAPGSAPVSSPTQVAYLQSEVQKARRQFARDASAITGVSAEKIFPLLPKDWRAGDPRYAVIPGLEKLRRAPLSDEQRQKINEADKAMKEAIAKARAEAAKR